MTSIGSLKTRFLTKTEIPPNNITKTPPTLSTNSITGG